MNSKFTNYIIDPSSYVVYMECLCVVFSSQYIYVYRQIIYFKCSIVIYTLIIKYAMAGVCNLF